MTNNLDTMKQIMVLIETLSGEEMRVIGNKIDRLVYQRKEALEKMLNDNK